MLPYQTDPQTHRFHTRVKSVVEEKDRVIVSLQKSYFYPEGGGQPSDQGTLNGKPVLRVFTEGEEIWHELEAFSGLTINMPVEGIIDPEKRLDHSVQHTAQHLFTAVLKDGFGVETVAFHLGEQYTTIDTDREVDEETLTAAEKRVNDLIGEDLPVSVYIRDKWNLGNLPLRKATDLSTNIRIVQIGEVDYCACGGTHVPSLKTLRLFRVMQSEKHKGGSRLYFLAGDRAFRYLRDMEDTVRLLQKEVQVNVDELPFRVVRLREERDDYRKMVQELTARLGVALAQGYTEDTVVQEVDFEDELMKAVGLEMNRRNKVAVFYRPDGRIFLFTGEAKDARKIFESLKARFALRGGGSKSLVQGILEKPEEMGSLISQVYSALLDLEI